MVSIETGLFPGEDGRMANRLAVLVDGLPVASVMTGNPMTVDCVIEKLELLAWRLRSYKNASTNNAVEASTDIEPKMSAPKDGKYKNNTVKNCMKDLQKLRGLGEFNSPSNIVFGDPYFAKSIDDNYSAKVIEMAKNRLGINK